MHRSSASQPRSSFAFPPWSRFHRLSCEVRPVGRGLTFVPGNIATRIRTITIRPSLLPTSQTRTTKSEPCGLLPPKGGGKGFRRSAVRVHRVRCLLSTGGFRITRADYQAALPIPITFWFKRVSHFRLLMNNGLYRRFTCVHRTDYLALIRLVAARGVCLLRLIPRTLRRFVTLSEPLFIQAPRFTP